MKKVMKQTASSILTLALTASMLAPFSNVYASELKSESEDIKETVAGFLSDTEYSTMKDIGISNAYTLSDLETEQPIGSLYVVFENNKAIGVVSEYSDSMATYQECNSNAFDEALEEEKPVAFYANNSAVFAYDGDTMSNVNDGDVVDVAPNDADYNEVKTAETNLEKYALAANSSYERKLSNFMRYCVGSELINGYETSWAAAIASKKNYKDGAIKTEAVDVYNDLLSLLEKSNPEAVSGSVDAMQELLVMYGLYSTYKPGSLSVSRVYNSLCADEPIIIRMSSDNAISYPVVDGVIFGSKYYNNTTGQSFAFYDIYDPIEVASFKAKMTSSDDFSGNSSESFNGWVCSFSFK